MIIMTIDEMIEVLIAYQKGKDIQCQIKSLPADWCDNWKDEWTDCDPPRWNFGEFIYRVKPY